MEFCKNLEDLPKIRVMVVLKKMVGIRVIDRIMVRFLLSVQWRGCIEIPKRSNKV